MSGWPAVSLRLDSRPETLTLVRGMLGGLAELMSLDPELLDDLKTAVSEACNNVVMHAYPGHLGELSVQLRARPDYIEVTVADQGRGLGEGLSPEERTRGVGLPVMRALAQSIEFSVPPGGGTEVMMRFAGHRDGKPLFQAPPESAPDDGFARKLPGTVAASVSPPTLLGGVLGRLARALAATARFSLDRFSDVYLVTDAIAGYVSRHTAEGRIAFSVGAKARELEVSVGPVQLPQSDGAVSTEELMGEPGDSPLVMLTDRVERRQIEGCDVLRVVMLDRR